MTRLLRRNIVGVPDSTRLNKDVKDLRKMVRDAISAELHYACRYWAVHLERAEVGDEGLLTRLDAFALQCILWWLEVASAVAAVPQCVYSLDAACNWAVRYRK